MSQVDELEHGILVVREAHRTKVKQLEEEIAKLIQRNKDKELHSQELERKILRLEDDIQQGILKTKQLAEEQNRTVNENVKLIQELSKLRKELDKLFSFKKAIIATFDEEDLPEAFRSQSPNLSSSNHLRSSDSITNQDDSNSFKPTVRFSITNPVNSEVNSESLEFLQNDRIISSPVSPSSSSRLNIDELDFSTTDARSQTTSPGQIEGKAFFREARQRLTYDQFNNLISNIKNLNNRSLTKEETLERTRRIFGNDNNDLFWTFKKLLSKQV